MRLHFCEVLQYNKSHRALVKSVIIRLYNNKAPTNDDSNKTKKINYSGYQMQLSDYQQSFEHFFLQSYGALSCAPILRL